MHICVTTGRNKERDRLVMQKLMTQCPTCCTTSVQLLILRAPNLWRTPKPNLTAPTAAAAAHEPKPAHHITAAQLLTHWAAERTSRLHIATVSSQKGKKGTLLCSQLCFRIDMYFWLASNLPLQPTCHGKKWRCMVTLLQCCGGFVAGLIDGWC